MTDRMTVKELMERLAQYDENAIVDLTAYVLDYDYAGAELTVKNDTIMETEGI